MLGGVLFCVHLSVDTNFLAIRPSDLMGIKKTQLYILFNIDDSVLTVIKSVKTTKAS
ncbi:hypothetical protein BCL69_101910 [Nitrosomonas communis]|uniref:Uncharacterized protein n=1 Tax=Nitrosomonas communis TaxID=44574 RepID=A0A5D3YD11_9PROT|nr:hypothetical protein BCL69_101910 [Nitrosomonas communis]